MQMSVLLALSVSFSEVPGIILMKSGKTTPPRTTRMPLAPTGTQTKSGFARPEIPGGSVLFSHFSFCCSFMSNVIKESTTRVGDVERLSDAVKTGPFDSVWTPEKYHAKFSDGALAAPPKAM